MRPSLRRRLLTLSVTATLLVVGGVSVFVWLMMSYSLRQSLDQTLRTEALTLAGRIEEEYGRLEFELAPANLEHEAPGGDALIRIVSDKGRVIFSSPELADAGSGGPLWPPGSPDRRTNELNAPAGGDAAARRPQGAGATANPVSWFDAPLGPANRPYRVVALHAVPSSEDAESAVPRAWVYVARPLAPLHDTLRRLAGVLLLTVAGAGVVALGLAFLIARSGTAPIRTMAGV